MRGAGLVKKPYQFDFTHSGSEVLENWLNQLAGKDIEEKVFSEEFQKKLYYARKSTLKASIDINSQRKKELEQEMINAIQEVLLTKGVELLRVTQMLEVECLDLGACESKIWGLEGRTS